MSAPHALSAVLPALACPVCAAPLSQFDASLRCTRGHSFDVARQGYVSLLGGAADPSRADTADMVAARDAFLGAGHYAPIAAALAASIPDAAAGPLASGICADVAGGTAYYLAEVLAAHPKLNGISLDLSTAASRKAARAHPRALAVAADLRATWPIADGSVSVLLNVFGPRNGAEFARVLAPEGVLLVVTPTPRHLAELRARLGLIEVDERKPERLLASLPGFLRDRETALEFGMRLGRGDIRNLVLMGPNAHHVDKAELDARLEGFDETSSVTASVVLTAFRAR